MINKLKRAVTLKTLADQDWKTQLVHKYPNIPNNAIVEIINEDFTNFYGSWCQVRWNNHNYYVSKRDLDFSEVALEQAEKYYKEELSQYEEKFKIT